VHKARKIASRLGLVIQTTNTAGLAKAKITCL